MPRRQPMMGTMAVLMMVTMVLIHGEPEAGSAVDAAAGTGTTPLQQKPAARFSAARAARAPRSDDVSTCEVLLQQQAQQLSQLTADVAALKTKLDRAQTSVAFQARNSADPFPVAKGAPIVFDAVITNINNAYDDHTGFFTAPVSGIYTFHVSCMAVTSTSIAFTIVASDVRVAQCWSTSTGSSELGSTDVSVHLQQGGKVWARAEYSVNVRGTFWSSFGGHLVRADDV